MLTRVNKLSLTGALAFALTLLCSSPVLHAQRASDNPPELSEKVSSGIQPLSAMVDAKKWDDALKVIDGFLNRQETPAYDRAFLSGYKAQLLFAKNDAIGAIEPLENMLRIADENKFFRFARALTVSEADTLSTLAQLYIQDAQSGNKPIEQQRALMAKAHRYGVRLSSNPKVSADAQFLWARILYSEATLDSNQVDMTMMKQCADAAAKALRLVIQPKDEFYTLYLAALQQLGETAKTAELLELMVKKFPNNKTFWPLLFQTYLILQGSNDKSAELSAIVTLERAQAVGQMVSNKDNFALAGLYYNSQQYKYAAELLETGLRSGKIDSLQSNWELLAACYQQLGREARSIDIFHEAIKIFPKSPTLEYMVGQVYYNSDKPELALKHFQNAVAKGMEKPGQTLVHIAYLALELKRLEEALAAAESAVKADPKSKEAASILKLIQESIRDRENFKKSK